MPDRARLSDLEAVPHAAVFDGVPRTVRLQLDADEALPPHQHPGQAVVLHLLEGRLELRLGDDRFELSPGELIRFAGDQDIAPRAIDPSVAVLVFAPAADR